MAILDLQIGHLEVQKKILFEWMKSNFPVGYDTFETGYGQLGTLAIQNRWVFDHMTCVVEYSIR